MQKSAEVTYKLSVEDVQKAIEMYLKSQGETAVVKTVAPEFVRESYPIGVYDCGYVNVFNGVTVKGKVE